MVRFWGNEGTPLPLFRRLPAKIERAILGKQREPTTLAGEKNNIYPLRGDEIGYISFCERHLRLLDLRVFNSVLQGKIDDLVA